MTTPEDAAEILLCCDAAQPTYVQRPSAYDAAGFGADGRRRAIRLSPTAKKLPKKYAKNALACGSGEASRSLRWQTRAGQTSFDLGVL